MPARASFPVGAARRDGRWATVAPPLFAVAGTDHLRAGLDVFEQPREMSLSLMDVNSLVHLKHWTHNRLCLV